MPLGEVEVPKNHTRHLLFLLLLTAALQPGWAQVVVSGSVSDTSGQPLELVNIAAVNFARPPGTTTDGHGRYRLSLLHRDTLHLRFSFTGYKSYDTLLVGLPPRCDVTLHVRLRSTLQALGEVVISDDKSRDAPFTHIERTHLEHVAGPSDGVEALLKTLPDVSSSNELSSQYSVRGGSFDENLVYINGVEVVRPMLIHSGQQEGMSIINPDPVDHILFSPGGFDASYGDKMASVLDLTYAHPTDFHARLSASFLGASASVRGRSPSQRVAYSIGARQHTNRYLFRSMDTRGAYTTSYTDLQAILGVRLTERLDVGLLGIVSRNAYGLVPEERVTTFGSFNETLRLNIYFDGAETDRYRTALGAVRFDYRPADNVRLRWVTSAQQNVESELYDVQGQYWLYELNVGAADTSEGTLDRGIGTYLEHARNRLRTTVVASELSGTHDVRLGQWRWGLQLRVEEVNDQVREWKWVDSADYTLPTPYEPWGDSSLLPQAPLLQLFSNGANTVRTVRAVAYGQRSFDFTNRRDDHFSFQAGLRGQLYRVTGEGNLGADSATAALASPRNVVPLLSPRLSFNFRPHGARDLLFRLSSGVYHQPPFYREYRRDDGSLNLALKAQHSYQIMGTADWNFHVGNDPFRLTADVYYKYVTNLIPYRIDNLRLRYDAHNDAVAYATGVSLRINGEFVPGLESWASLSLLKTQEDIAGDGKGWLDRPTDQRISFKIFVQDYIPSIPFWRMSLSFIYASGLPTTPPDNRTSTLRLRPYLRVDWSNSVELSRIERLRHSRLMSFFDEVFLSIEVFNLFDYVNEVSYMWVSDYSGLQYGVPNRLTARQLSLKVTATF